MKRDLIEALVDWKNRTNRKSLIIKGARQVGKTYLVREFGNEFSNLCEVNFEERPELKEVFVKNLDVKRIVRDIGLILDLRIEPGKTLLFFDEINECPLAIKSLRYFYEKMPSLHVVASGSLLDFTIEETGVPVGRVEFMHLYPMSFSEFISNIEPDNNDLVSVISDITVLENLSGPVHKKILDLLGIYYSVGGMPEAVAEWIESSNYGACSRIHNQILTAYRDDFEKYAKRNKIKYVDTIFTNFPALLGRKFKYSTVSDNFKSRELAPALDLLVKAFIIHKVYHSSGNGVPLGGEANHKKFKVIFLDIALTQALMGIDYKDWILDAESALTKRGEIAEAFVGQELIAYSDYSKKAQLYYWLREKAGASAEVDYLIINEERKVCPVEVKSGTTGTLKSLNIFLKEKLNSKYGIHFSKRECNIENNIQSLPLYSVMALRKKRKKGKKVRHDF